MKLDVLHVVTITHTLTIQESYPHHHTTQKPTCQSG